MKNLTLPIVTIIFSVLIFNACTDNSNDKIELNLSESLSSIEQKVQENSFENINAVTPFDNVNKTFFIELLELNSIENENTIKNSRENLLNKYNENLNKISANISSQLNNEEELIFKSYFKSLKKNESNKILITEFYISEIKKLNISNESLEFCLNNFSFIKNLFTYIKFDEQNNLSYRGVNFDSCWDNCMSKKADAVFLYGNWVDQVDFMASAGPTVLKWTASCTWDCF